VDALGKTMRFLWYVVLCGAIAEFGKRRRRDGDRNEEHARPPLPASPTAPRLSAPSQPGLDARRTVQTGSWHPRDPAPPPRRSPFPHSPSIASRRLERPTLAFAAFLGRISVDYYL